MKKYLLTLSLSLLSSGFLLAQDNSSISLQLPVKKIDAGSDSIASIQIISNITDSIFIGILPSTFPNVRTNVVIPQGVQTWLQDYATQQFGNPFQPKGKQLIWVINALRVGKDSSASGATSFTKLTADVYTGSGGTYRLKTQFDTLMVSKETNPDFGSTLATAINALYKNSVSATKGVKQDANKPLTEAEILQTAEASHDFNILSDSTYPTGVFVLFKQFLNNSPSIAKFYTMVDSATKNVHVYQFFEDSSSQLLPDVWGICINNELYRYQDGQLYAIEKKENGFTLSKYIDFRKRKNQAFFWRRYIGERQGDNNPFNDAHIYRVTISKKPMIKVEATVLDMTTGNISSY